MSQPIIIRKAQRKKVKIKMGIQGSSGSGKTYSSLLMAKGLVGGDISKVCIIDTENGSADLYSDLGAYSVVTLTPPFSPGKYAKAIDAIVESGSFECIIMDSISHCWEYLLAKHASMTGNSFTNWGKITPIYKAFVNKILQAPIHVISTMRSKEEYVLTEKKGRFVPEKVGMKAIQRDGLGYEFTILFEVDIKHNAIASKDRTRIFVDNPGFLISEETGAEILNWCQDGVSLDAIKRMIAEAKDKETLRGIYQEYGSMFSELRDLVLAARKSLPAPVEE